MLRITIELLPHGSEKHKKPLGMATITNDGTGSESFGNYNVKLYTWHEPPLKYLVQLTRTWKTGRVELFPRKTRGPWDLLYRALRDIVGERNKQENNYGL